MLFCRIEQLKTQSFAVDEARTAMEEMEQETAVLRIAAEDANKRASSVDATVDGLREETVKAKELAERQQEVRAQKEHLFKLM